MPSKSDKQARLMRAIAHGWKKPGSDGPSKKVAKEFVKADKKPKNPKSKAKINKQDTRHGKLDLPFTNLNRYAGKAAGGEVASKKEDNPADDLTPIGNLPGGPTREKHDPVSRGGKRRPKKDYKSGGEVRGSGCATRGKGGGRFI